MTMIKYQNKRNNRIALFISHDDRCKTTKLQWEEDGKSFDVSDSTFKRWYKKLEDQEPVVEVESTLVAMPGTEDPEWGKKHFGGQETDSAVVELAMECPEIQEEELSEIQQAMDDFAGDGTPLAEVGKEIFQQAKEKAKTAKRTKAKKEMSSYVQDAMDFVFAWVKEHGDDIFVPANGMNMRSFKVDGHMYTKFDFTCTSITIGVKSVALPEGVRTPDRTLNHMFDAVYQFKQELTDADKDLIQQLLESARDYRVLKNNNSKKEEK